MYQEVFNKYLKKIRWVCNATNNSSLGDTIVKIMFDFSDEMKNKGLVSRGEQENGK